MMVRIVLVTGLLLLSFTSLSAQLPSQDPGHKQNAVVAGVKFSVPKDFNFERSSDPRVAFMRHDKYHLALFVAAPEKQVDDEYLEALSNTLVSQLFPTEKEFRWKFFRDDSDSKVSKFQTSSGATKGYNNQRFFQTHYITVNVKGREILVGYITELGEYINNQKALWEAAGSVGMSMPGWYAQAHILASITGEKYAQINPGTVIRGTPINKN